MSITKTLPACVAALFCLISCCICQKTWPESDLKKQHKSGGTKLSSYSFVTKQEKQVIQ